MYKVKNKSKDVRKFRDALTGRQVFVKPGEFAITSTPVKSSSVFSVEEIKEQNKKEKTNKLEDN